jgi:hypothetical protein
MLVLWGLVFSVYVCLKWRALRTLVPRFIRLPRFLVVIHLGSTCAVLGAGV